MIESKHARLLIALVIAAAGCDTGPTPMDDGGAPPDGGGLCDGVLCDNDVFCDGLETCDESNGECVPGADPCSSGEVCVEETDECLPAALPECEIGTSAGTAACDYSCIGSTSAPVGGAEVTVSAFLADMMDGSPEPDTLVHVYLDNEPGTSDTCGAGCLEMTTDAAGRFEVSAPEGSWFAYRIVARAGGGDVRPLVDSVERNLVASGSSDAVLTSVQPSLRDILPLLWGFSRTDGTAMIIGGAEDCGGARVSNLQVHVFDPDGIEVGTERYFDGTGTPSPTATMSALDGLYASVEVPVPADGRPVRVELWGTLPGDDFQTRVGCEETRLLGDGLSLLDIRPLREDGPASCRP